jgi:ribonuclease HI
VENKIIIYSDGACSGNPGPGGWGAILIYGNHKKEISGYELDTTNNRMEMLAAIEAIKCVKKKIDIYLYTDSVYLKNGMTQWLPVWIANNWRKKHNSEVKNIDLWQILHQLSKEHHIIWNWVKGHSNNEGNAQADLLAVAARKKAESILKNKE